MHLQRINSIVAFDDLWQRPANTEEYAYRSLLRRSTGRRNDGFVYVGFPWATLIDLLNHGQAGGRELHAVAAEIPKFLNAEETAVTVCQHIMLPDFLRILRECGIREVFWSHTTRCDAALTLLGGEKLYPFPLCPVQALGGESYPEGTEKKFLYSFVGAEPDSGYLSASRQIIFQHLSGHPSGLIVRRSKWHYFDTVYGQQIFKTIAADAEAMDQSAAKEYRAIMRSSIFCLCPSGTGPNTIRLWEAICCGAIPVILSDTYQPPGDADLWREAALFCPETRDSILALPAKLEQLVSQPLVLEQKRAALRKLRDRYGPECFIYDVLRRLEGRLETEPSREEKLALQDGKLEQLSLAMLPGNDTSPQTALLFLRSLAHRLATQTGLANALLLSASPLRRALDAAVGCAGKENLQGLRLYLRSLFRQAQGAVKL